jgi:hypothetical protein
MGRLVRGEALGCAPEGTRGKAVVLGLERGGFLALLMTANNETTAAVKFNLPGQQEKELRTHSSTL